MAAPPLHLSVLRLTPSTLLDPDHPSSSYTPSPVPLHPLVRPSIPSSFSLSPTHNYPAPFGSMSLGSNLAVHVQLTSHSPDGEPVKGVKMMLEVQGPAGRWRLGEVVHGELKTEERVDGGKTAADGPDQSTSSGVTDIPEDSANGKEESQVESELLGNVGTASEDEEEADVVPELPSGEFVELDVSAEMKELGLQVLICSVAWETLEGRRTFQRFFKFNVIAPLAIKTRIHASQTPSSLLDPTRRGDVFLEVLMQNTSGESLLFDKITLEPVYGLAARRITASHLPSDELASRPTTPPVDEDEETGESLHPNDTRQYLFLLHPSPPPPTRGNQSVFPPVFAPGTVLPLGRLDISWVAGSYRERGRLQTSTLNRRVPAAPPIPKINLLSSPAPTRTNSAAPPTPGQTVSGLPASRRDGDKNVAEETSEKGLEWEYDVAVVDLDRDSIEVDDEFTARLRIAVRSSTVIDGTGDSEDAEKLDQSEPATAPKPLILGVQYLTDPGPSNDSLGPSFTQSPASRSGSPIPPVSRPDTSRPFSPSTPTRDTTAGPSRTQTPVSMQLRQATQSHLSLNSITQSSRTPQPTVLSLQARPVAPSVAFPPLPVLSRPPIPPKPGPNSGISGMMAGKVYPLGPSLRVLSPLPFIEAQEQYSTTYGNTSEPPVRWEAVHEVEMRFLALEEGLAALGGLRVLVMDDELGSGGAVGKEWDSLGDVWVTG